MSSAQLPRRYTFHFKIYTKTHSLNPKLSFHISLSYPSPMRIRRSLAKLSATNDTSSDPSNLQNPRRCSNATTSGIKNSIITCFMNQSPWDVAELALPKLVGGLFSLSGTTAVAEIFRAPEISLCSSVKLSNEEMKQRLGVFAAGKSSEWNENCRRLITVRAEKSDSGKVVVSGKKSQIRPASFKEQLEANDSTSPKRRARNLKRSAGDPNEFYYYSGFGPHWGKKREKVSRSAPMANKSTTELKKEGNGKTEIEFVDYDDDSEDVDENGSGTRRPNVRKRVKARSLKSLM